MGQFGDENGTSFDTDKYVPSFKETSCFEKPTPQLVAVHVMYG